MSRTYAWQYLGGYLERNMAKHDAYPAREVLALIVATVALLVLSTGTAGAQEATAPPRKCNAASYENRVFVQIEDDDRAHTQFAVRAINRDNGTYKFLGRVNVNTPRTDEQTEVLTFESTLSSGRWTIAARSFDAAGKSGWTNCSNISASIPATNDPFLDCDNVGYEAETRTVDIRTYVSPAPLNTTVQYSVSNDIYNQTFDLGTLDAQPYESVVQAFNVPNSVRKGTWFISAQLLVDGIAVVDSQGCGKLAIRDYVPPAPFSCEVGIIDFTVTAYINHAGVADGARFAVNLERGERPNEEFRYIGRFNEDDDQTVAVSFDRNLVDPTAGWRVKARWIAADGTKSDRIDCGEVR